MDYTVHGILQARILEWVVVPLSGGSSQPRDRTQVSCIASGYFTNWILDTSQVICLLSEVAQSCLTLCDPMNCSLPGSSVHGILQAVVLEWIAISFSRGSSQSRAIVYRLFTVWATRESICLLLCYILDFSGNSQFRSLLLFQSFCNHRNHTQCLKSW